MSTAIHLALRAHAESLSGFPALREHENLQFTPPTNGDLWSEEDFVPSGAAMTSLGSVEERGLYVVRLYAALNTGMKALRDLAAALCAWFPPRWFATLGDGTLVRTRNDALPYAGQITNSGAFAYCVVTIPYRTEYRAAA